MGSPEPEDDTFVHDVSDHMDPGQSGGHDEQASQAAEGQGAQDSNGTNTGTREDIDPDNLL